MIEIAEELQRAGLITLDERLKEIALKAMVRNAGSMAATEDAIWEAVRKDAALIDALLAPHRHRALSHLLDRTRKYLGWRSAVGTNAETMHIPSEDHLKPANSPLERRAQLVSIAWDREHKTELHKQQAAEIKRLTEYREWRNAWQQTAAAELRINDKPFWTVSVNEARRWIATTGHSARFMELVVAGLPNDERPIEYYRKAEEIDALWEQAKT